MSYELRMICTLFKGCEKAASAAGGDRGRGRGRDRGGKEDRGRIPLTKAEIFTPWFFTDNICKLLQQSKGNDL